jgi:hypothetical protein
VRRSSIITAMHYTAKYAFQILKVLERAGVEKKFSFRHKIALLLSEISSCETIVVSTMTYTIKAKWVLFFASDNAFKSCKTEVEVTLMVDELWTSMTQAKIAMSHFTQFSRHH